MTRRNLFALADSRARLSEAQRTTTQTTTCKQRPALAREMRRLGWHRTKATN